MHEVHAYSDIWTTLKLIFDLLTPNQPILCTSDPAHGAERGTTVRLGLVRLVGLRCEVSVSVRASINILSHSAAHFVPTPDSSVWQKQWGHHKFATNISTTCTTNQINWVFDLSWTCCSIVTEVDCFAFLVHMCLLCYSLAVYVLLVIEPAPLVEEEEEEEGISTNDPTWCKIILVLYFPAV